MDRQPRGTSLLTPRVRARAGTTDAPRDLLRSLVAIDSVNPALVPGAAGETGMARAVEAWCRQQGIETTWLEATPGRPSVLARVPGRGGGRSLLLNAHLDTVGTAGMEAPFEARVRDGRLFGRGSMDMKASVAACLVTLARAQRARFAGDVLFAAVADEEHGSIGTREVLEHVRTDAAIVTEPSGLDLHVAHRGFAVCEVTVRGLASHTSQPERGANAVAAMGRVLAGVAALDQELRSRPPHPLLGHGSVQPVLIHGGRELFTTPDACTLSVERRTLPGERGADAVRELQDIVTAALRTGAGCSGSVDVVVDRDPFEVSEEEEIVRVVEGATRSARGAPPALLGAPYWMDAALLAAAGIPTVVIGPLGGGIHGADEWVDLASVDTLVEVLAAAAHRWCS